MPTCADLRSLQQTLHVTGVQSALYSCFVLYGIVLCSRIVPHPQDQIVAGHNHPDLGSIPPVFTLKSMLDDIGRDLLHAQGGAVGLSSVHSVPDTEILQLPARYNALFQVADRYCDPFLLSYYTSNSLPRSH